MRKGRSALVGETCGLAGTEGFLRGGKVGEMGWEVVVAVVDGGGEGEEEEEAEEGEEGEGGHGEEEESGFGSVELKRKWKWGCSGERIGHGVSIYSGGM